MTNPGFRDATQREIEMLDYLMKPKGVKGFWEDVEIFMKYFYETYPSDMKALEVEAETERRSAYNKFASNRFNTHRVLGKMPEMLNFMLDRIYNRRYPISQKRFQREFFKRYPKLRVADTI